MPPPDPNPDRLLALSLSKWFAEEVQPHEPALRAWLPLLLSRNVAAGSVRRCHAP